MTTESGPSYVIITSPPFTRVGYLAIRDGNTVTLTNARYVYDRGAAQTLYHLAANGPTDNDDCKFSPEVPRATISGVVELIFCTRKAEAALRAVPAW